jgi:alkanesulfonate monooxygenase SsuD/methylene tetrahydromethanopterin reductase-like flavin-dependent oxidoreductase (luciferase family)
MKFAINLLNFGRAATPKNFTAWVRYAESNGFDAVMISDHVTITEDVSARYPEPFYDPFVLLGWAASITTQVELGTSVTIIPYRHPLHTARLVANIDHLSKGRFIFGAAVGWAKQEFAALGVDFDHRGTIANEHLRVMKSCWSAGVTTLRKPHPPIWIGGSSDAALRRAVRYGTAWHPIRPRIDWLRSVGLPRLKELAAADGKAVPELCPRIEVQLATAAQTREDLGQLTEIGATYVTLDTYSGDPDSTADLTDHFTALDAVRP